MNSEELASVARVAKISRKSRRVKTELTIVNGGFPFAEVGECREGGDIVLGGSGKTVDFDEVDAENVRLVVDILELFQ